MATEPYQDFLFAMNSPVTRERYSTRLRSFLVFVGIEGSTMDERCRRFVAKVKENEKNGNSKWAYACVLQAIDCLGHDPVPCPMARRLHKEGTGTF
jgi:hypothetical protein